MSTLDELYATWCETESEPALSALHKALFQRALRVIGQVLKQERPDLASDAASDTILKIRQFRGESAFSTWAHKIAKNIALLEVRRENPGQLEQLENGDEFAARETGIEEWRELITTVLSGKSYMTVQERSLLEAMLLGQQPQDWSRENGYHRQTGWRIWQSLKRKLQKLRKQT